jgi:hypothetical protein
MKKTCANKKLGIEFQITSTIISVNDHFIFFVIVVSNREESKKFKKGKDMTSLIF